jgi:hypothetical protein
MGQRHSTDSMGRLRNKYKSTSPSNAPAYYPQFFDRANPMRAKPRFVTFPSEFVPDLPVLGRAGKDFGKGWDGRKFASVVLNNW